METRKWALICTWSCCAHAHFAKYWHRSLARKSHIIRKIYANDNSSAQENSNELNTWPISWFWQLKIILRWPLIYWLAVSLMATPPHIDWSVLKHSMLAWLKKYYMPEIFTYGANISAIFVSDWFCRSNRADENFSQ